MDDVSGGKAAPRNGDKYQDGQDDGQHHEGPFHLPESCLEDWGRLEDGGAGLAPVWPPLIMLL